MKIIVDAMGGDFAPKAPVEGALAAVRELGAQVILVGRAERILAALEELGQREVPAGIEIVHCEQIVEVEDNPATVLREKKDASMIVALRLLKEGKGEAMLSAGSTGALLSCATLMIKRIRGIRRAALAPVIPTQSGSAVLIDCGATAECTPEYLLQFAFMGSYYAKRYLDRPKPKVGLLNIGAEPSKGTHLQRETHALLTQAHEDGRIHFYGNVEAKEAILGEVDVVVSDGFSGNIFLKSFEGTALFMNGMLKKAFTKGLFSKLAAALVMGDIREMKKKLDPSEVGGTILLGISKPVIKAHGSSNAFAIRNAIGQSLRLANSGLIEDITVHIDDMKLAESGVAEIEES